MKKHSEAFQDFLESLNSKSVQSTFQKPVFNLAKFQKLDKTVEVEGSVLFFQDTFSYKIKKDLHVNFKAFEYLCVKFENKNSKNIILNLVYRPPNVYYKELENHFKTSLPKLEISKNDKILAGDFNINLRHLDANKKV